MNRDVVRVEVLRRLREQILRLRRRHPALGLHLRGQLGWGRDPWLRLAQGRSELFGLQTTLLVEKGVCIVIFS